MNFMSYCSSEFGDSGGFCYCRIKAVWHQRLWNLSVALWLSAFKLVFGHWYKFRPFLLILFLLTNVRPWIMKRSSVESVNQVSHTHNIKYMSVWSWIHNVLHPVLPKRPIYSIISTRGWKNLDRDKFRDALKNSPLCVCVCGDLEELKDRSASDLFDILWQISSWYSRWSSTCSESEEAISTGCTLVRQILSRGKTNCPPPREKISEKWK